jgi:hypothetical protein
VIRFFLLGGRLGPVPWQLLFVMGVACLGASVLILLVGSGVLYYAVVEVESAVFAVAGASLLAVGIVRRGRLPPPPTSGR